MKIQEPGPAYIEGYTDGLFQADRDITRAEAVKMLYGLGNGKTVWVD